MAGTSSVGGLISGLDTATIINQLISVSARRIDVVVFNQTTHSDKLTAFQSLNTQLLDFKSKAKTLKDSDTFNVFKTATTTDSTNFKASDLLTVSTTTDASPGTHTIEFTPTSQLAQARQLSSQSYTSASTALNLSGEFVINGKAINITTTDTLSDIAVKINNANSGSNATGVTATILSASSTDNRLILTSDNTGEGKFSILDASATGTDILQSLGLTNSIATIKNTTSDGAKSDKFSSSTTAVGSLLGLTSAQNSSTVQIAGTNVTINLATQDLTTIASTINGVAGVTASVVSTTTDGVTTFQIDISGTTSFVDSNNILETLGILEGQQGSISEVHTASTVNNDLGASPIVAGTFFDQIDTTGGPGNDVQNNDTITISGTDHNGNAVSGTFTITDKTTQTVGNLLTQIETVLEQNGGGNSFTASIVGGQIVITDDQAGDSQLSVNIVTNNEGGGTLDFGAVTATTQGYAMQTTAGQDVNVKIDGVAVSRSSNSIDDVISGVTIDLKRAETDGTIVNLTISRDTDSIKSSINDFITEYNSIIDFINQQFTFDEDTESSGVLAGESALFTIKSIIQSTITSANSLLPANNNALSLIGITSDINGKLSLKDSDFLSAINTDFNAVRRLFTAEGTTTNSEITHINHTKETVQGDYAVVINTVATQATVTGTGDLSSGIGGAGDVLDYTITDTSTGRVATITLDGSSNGSSLDNIVNTINSELARESTETLVGSVQNTESASAITSSTLLKNFDTGGGSLATNDVIQISGTTRSGTSVGNSFTITDLDTTTVQDFLSFIENSYNNEVSATINGSGSLVLTDNTVGDSQLSIDITEPGTLNFGTVLTTNTGGVAGRFAMEITASKSGNNLVITHDSYGGSNGFSTSETIVSGAPTLPVTTTGSPFKGTDVAGTINGEAATGAGQILTGDAPPSGGSTSIEGLSIKVTSTTTGSKGNVKLTIGVAEEMYRELDFFTDQFDGLLTVRMDGLQDTIDSLQDTIDGMEERLVMERIRLENQFVQLELSLARLQTISSFLTKQLGLLSTLSS
ncbi:MAG: flagellar filament capping protein FliD [Candidatus Scalindua sediminis]|nr:flagellar filament capping protein FliD [Candidatus Scalindua sediminis]